MVFYCLWKSLAPLPSIARSSFSVLRNRDRICIQDRDGAKNAGVKRGNSAIKLDPNKARAFNKQKDWNSLRSFALSSLSSLQQVFSSYISCVRGNIIVLDLCLCKAPSWTLSPPPITRACFGYLQDAIWKNHPNFALIYKNAKDDPKGKIARQAELVNELMEKAADGKTWVVKADKPMFKEAHKSIAEDESKDRQVSKPWGMWAEELRDG